MYKLLVKPLLFLLSPEKAHHVVFKGVRFFFRLGFIRNICASYFKVKDKALERRLFGLTFANPVGLAAGFDKDAKLFNELDAFGFGFIEIGTVTPEPQAGNPQPRLFRLPKDEALINRMGFNNEGVEAAAARLRGRKGKLLIGANIGKNKLTPEAQASSDYEKSFNSLFELVDYFVLNVSSPNTPNLRNLQDKEPLTQLLQRIMELNNKHASPKPVLLKIAPDVTNEQLDDIIEVVQKTGIAGIIATNTTISREGLKTPQGAVEEIGAGGLSGRPVGERSTEVIAYIAAKTGGKLPIVGVGGIHSAEEAIEKLKAGASLVQLYTGFIYEGPGLVRRINKELLKQKV